MLVGKLFCSFLNSLISLYIYYDQSSMKKYGEKNSRGSIPWKLNWKRHICMANLIISLHGDVKNLKRIENCISGEPLVLQ